MTQAFQQNPSRQEVLGKATINAARAMGLSMEELGRIVGRDRTTLSRSGVDPDTLSGQAAATLIRIYRSAEVLTGSSQGVQTWLNTPNRAFNATPKACLFKLEGLARVIGYLDAHRGKL